MIIQWPGDAAIRPALNVDGRARKPVQHWSYIQQSYRLRGHKLDPGTRAGAWQCSLCGRWVIRGVGKWWE